MNHAKDRDKAGRFRGNEHRSRGGVHSLTKPGGERYPPTAVWPPNGFRAGSLALPLAFEMHSARRCVGAFL
jgi:hypothetical protein